MKTDAMDRELIRGIRVLSRVWIIYGVGGAAPCGVTQSST